MFTMSEEIIKRTSLIFATMFQVEVEAGVPYTVDPSTDTGWDISGVISVAGDLSGLIAMRYHKKLANLMLERTKLQAVKSDINQSLLNDMIGEVANTIAGNVMSGRGVDKLLLSIPITVQGEEHTISWPPNTEVISVPFKIGSEIFVVQAGLK
jgi:CheY-specific phosphatase CheX